MNIEILKRNIEQVIMQPCIAKPWLDTCMDVKLNGLSEDRQYIMVKTHPDDSSWRCSITDEHYVERIIEMLPEKYRDKLVTLRHDNWVNYSYLPVFDTDTQTEWDIELNNYLSAKQAWYNKHGCD